MKYVFLGLVLIIVLTGCGSDSDDSSTSLSTIETSSLTHNTSSSNVTKNSSSETKGTLLSNTQKKDLNEHGIMEFDGFSIEPVSLEKGTLEGTDIVRFTVKVTNISDATQSLKGPGKPIAPTLSQDKVLEDQTVQEPLSDYDRGQNESTLETRISPEETKELHFDYAISDNQPINILMAQYDGNQHQFTVTF